MSEVAVIEAGGTQHLVRPGERLLLRHVQTTAKGLHFVDLLSEKKVTATVVATRRLPKVPVRKFKSKVRYLRRKSSRDRVAEVLIGKIGPSA